MIGSENNTMSGRSEQVNEILGIASTYACYNCCPNAYYDGWITPFNVYNSIGETASFVAMQSDMNCYGQIYPPYGAELPSWNSSDWNIAYVDLNGNMTSTGVGTANITASWTGALWFNDGGYRCDYIPYEVIRDAPVEVTPEVTINGPGTAKDGVTVTFSATTQGGTPTSYQWTYSIDTGSTGNNPQVNFNTPNAASTTALAHWYARPNSDCATSPPPASSSHPYYNSKYKIKVKVTFEGGAEISKEADFYVNAWWSPAGYVSPATISGGIAIGFNSTSQRWEVIGSGTMTRTTYPSVINIPSSSQFYNKTVQHESKHELQWATGLFQNTFAVSSFMTVIENFHDTSAQSLQQQINQAYLNWDQQQAQFYQSNLSAAEIEAYAISDLITPLFAYQRCGRTTWP